MVASVVWNGRERGPSRHAWAISRAMQMATVAATLPQSCCTSTRFREASRTCQAGRCWRGESTESDSIAAAAAGGGGWRRRGAQLLVVSCGALDARGLWACASPAAGWEGEPRPVGQQRVGSRSTAARWGCKREQKISRVRSEGGAVQLSGAAQLARLPPLPVRHVPRCCALALQRCFLSSDGLKFTVMRICHDEDQTNRRGSDECAEESRTAAFRAAGKMTGMRKKLGDELRCGEGRRRIGLHALKFRLKNVGAEAWQDRRRSRVDNRAAIVALFANAAASGGAVQLLARRIRCHRLWKSPKMLWHGHRRRSCGELESW